MKSIALHVIIIVLTSSILAPSFVCLFSAEIEQAWVLDANEEEQGKKEAEKDTEQQQLITEYIVWVSQFTTTTTHHVGAFYLKINSQQNTESLFRPPEMA